MKNDTSQMLAEIRLLLDQAIPEGERVNDNIPNIHAARVTRDIATTHCCEEPVVLLVAQGRKIIELGDQTFDLRPGEMMISCIEAPSTSSITDASAENPFMGMNFPLDRHILAELLLQLPEAQIPSHAPEGGAWAYDAGVLELDAFLRLARLLDKPVPARILGPLILRELHFLILEAPQGWRLRKIYMRGGRDSRILDILGWLKEHLRDAIAMTDLARMANMSISSFHRHFKALTGYSPLQYQKKMRLFEAQRLMLAEDRRAAEAAIEVGYESITQFNREYRKLFGQPPARDIAHLRRKFGG